MNPNTQFISTYFTRREAEFSSLAMRLGIDNTIPANILPTVIHTAHCLDKVRELLGCPIYVDSFYRCLLLNNELGSSPNSQHIKGEAVDIISPTYGTPIEICKAIISSGIDFDQLIYEYSWAHISFVSELSGRKNRKNVLTLDKDHKTYIQGLYNGDT